MKLRGPVLWCALLAMLFCQWAAWRPASETGSAAPATARAVCHTDPGTGLQPDLPDDADCHADACQPGGQNADLTPVLFRLVIQPAERFALARTPADTLADWAEAMPPVFEPPNLRDARLLI